MASFCRMFKTLETIVHIYVSKCPWPQASHILHWTFSFAWECAVPPHGCPRMLSFLGITCMGVSFVASGEEMLGSTSAPSIVAGGFSFLCTCQPTYFFQWGRLFLVYNINRRCPGHFHFHFKGTAYHQSHLTCVCFLGDLLAIVLTNLAGIVCVCSHALMNLWREVMTIKVKKNVMTRNRPGGEICFVVFRHSETCTKSTLQKDKCVIILSDCEHLADLEFVNHSNTAKCCFFMCETAECELRNISRSRHFAFW